jgi:hypothetical protein
MESYYDSGVNSEDSTAHGLPAVTQCKRSGSCWQVVSECSSFKCPVPLHEDEWQHIIISLLDEEILKHFVCTGEHFTCVISPLLRNNNSTAVCIAYDTCLTVIRGAYSF